MAAPGLECDPTIGIERRPAPPDRTAGSPPENITTSASPSDSTNTSSIPAHCSWVME
ncbi:hypothetical protein [Streptomyces sp. ALI-76-A]|uniref:hypothetical protein n=1 Tax=Streptomyces sp. ALI-76-A TaxID=3025736 RepID=UPI00256ED68A|nr:hypothetical protein [Streptomyces sp. ALI-76-A]MDL5206557.1 hypothetical protein [Streptomyces sp. ALI-76-A]